MSRLLPMLPEVFFGRLIGKMFIIGVWAATISLILLTSLEVYLNIKSAWYAKREAEKTRSTFEETCEAYLPFTVQHINPYYLFFFPFDRTERRKMNNEMCSVTPDGFRGPGPRNGWRPETGFFFGGVSCVWSFREFGFHDHYRVSECFSK